VAKPVRMTYLTAVVLEAVASGHRYGFDIMDATGIPDGTVYPCLRRLEKAALLAARWEDAGEAAAKNRPARKYYRLTAEGTEALRGARARFPGVARTFASAAKADA